MSVVIGDYEFDGVYELSNETIRECLEDRSGVYAVLCLVPDGLQPCWLLVDAGESRTVRSRLLKHNRKRCWLETCGGELGVAVYYMPYARKRGRKQIEREIREELQPYCGDR